MAFGADTFSDRFKEYGKRLANNIQTGMRATMAPKPPAQPTAPSPPIAQPTAPIAPAPTQNPAIQPQGLQPVEPISQAGQIYKQRVTQNLLNPNPLAQSAQATADTNISRRNYQTQKQTQEMMAQSPFGAGTRQYQRALMEGQAGANTANLGEQNQVNAYTRGLSEKAMSDAQGLEDTEFARALGERGYQDQNASRYSALIQDTKGRQAYNRMVASGMNPSVALQKVLDESGTINENYRGMNNIQQLQSEAGDWVEATQGLTPEMAGYKEAVRARMIAVDEAQQKPLSDASKQSDIQDIVEKQNLGQPLTQDEKDRMKASGEWDKVTLQTIPKGDAVNTWLKDNPDQMVTIDGAEYKVVRGGRNTTGYKKTLLGSQPRHTDYVEVLTPQGETKYIYGGKLNDNPPTPAVKVFTSQIGL